MVSSGCALNHEENLFVSNCFSPPHNFRLLVFSNKVNLNTFHDIAKDFRFYEDPADEFKFPGENIVWKKVKNSTDRKWNTNINTIVCMSP